MEVNADFGRPYTELNKELFESLPKIGQGGPNNSPDPERLLNAAPDVIFTTYATDSSDAEQLQKSTGIPVVALSYGSSFWGDEVQASIELIGRITGESEKSAAAARFITACYEDLQSRTGDIQDRPRVYVGGLGSRGTHGIESTQGQYAPFVALNADNVVDETGKRGSVTVRLSV